MEGLRPVRSYRVIPSGIKGHVGPLTVAIAPVARGPLGGRGTHVRVQGLAPISVRPARLDTAVQKRLLRGQEFEVGDPAFDDVAYVEGPPLVLQAILDHGTRLGIRQLLAGAVSDAASRRTFMTRAALRGELRYGFEDDSPLFLQEALPIALRAILDLARRLVPPDDLLLRLAANAREDPVGTVRLRNLESLRREYPQHPETLSALRDACRDASEVVRLFAATSLGTEGREVVRRLAAAAEEDACAARAVVVLGAELSATEALDLLAGALRRRRFATAAACMDGLEGRGGADAVGALSRVLADEKGPVAVAAARGLRYPALPGAEAVLLQRGIGHAEPAVRLAAATALGSVGSVEAVLPLQALGGRNLGQLGHAVREAVAAIQSRLTGAAPGQLSVSALEGGAVSLSPQGGEVSLPEAERAGGS